MKRADDIDLKELIRIYEELKSSYKVAKKFNVSATAVKRILKRERVLRTQSKAAKERKTPNRKGKKAKEETKTKISNFAKTRTGSKNPFFGKKHTDKVRKKLSMHAKTRTQKRNPNYKNGKHFRRPRDFKNAEFQKIRNFVFNRDKYKCTLCRDKSYLHAHHLVPYWVEPKAFLDTDNLITLCKGCHFKKGHLGNWVKFNVELIPDTLIDKYELCRERLNELANFTEEVELEAIV